MKYFLKLFLITMLSFFLIDMIWLGLIAQSFYKRHLGFIMAESPNWSAAIIFYIIFIIGILVFVVLPGLKKGSLKSTLVHAVFFGVLTYSTYDLTNLATLENWPVVLTIVDIIWGGVLTTLVCFISFIFGGKLKKDV
jgi:uncharacterized membrane protein